MQKNNIAQWEEAIDEYQDNIKKKLGTAIMRKQWQEAIEYYQEEIADALKDNIEGSKEISVVEKVKPSKNAPLVSKEIKEKIKQWMTKVPKRDKEYLEERPDSSYWYKYRVYIYVPERKDWDFREDESFNGLNKIEQDVQSIINNYPNLDHIDFLIYTQENDWDNFTIYEHPQVVSKESKKKMDEIAKNYEEQSKKYYAENEEYPDEKLEYAIYVRTNDSNEYDLDDFIPFSNVENIENDIKKIINSNKNLHHIEFRYPMSFGQGDVNEFTIYESEQQDKIDDKVDKVFWFEYHCLESPSSCDAEIWYRSHSKIEILGIVEMGNGETLQERAEIGEPRVYRARFEDGFEHDVYEDEVMNAPDEFHRPNPPKKPEKFSEQQAPLVSKENKKVDSNDVQDFNKEAGYKLSSNQIQFVRDAIASGLEVDYGYTSKGRYEEQVPCVVVPYIDLLETSSYYKTDVEGKNIIAFAPRGKDYMARGGQSRKIEVGDMVNVRSINKSGVVMECMSNQTCLVKFPNRQHDGYYNLSDLYLLTNDDEFAHGGSIQNDSNLSRMSALAKMLNYSQSLHKQARGGVMSDESFDSIVKNVSQRYEGKRVPKEYQKEYGKRYSKKESQQVGYKVANKVNSRKLQ